MLRLWMTLLWLPSCTSRGGACVKCVAAKDTIGT